MSTRACGEVREVRVVRIAAQVFLYAARLQKSISKAHVLPFHTYVFQVLCLAIYY